MGRRALPKERTLDPELRERWLESLVPWFLENGFSGAKMEDITKFLGISKATLYEHYSSRDELFELVVERVLSDIGKNRDVLIKEELSYKERYVLLCGIILNEVTGISSAFLEDLKYNFPDLWQMVLDFYQSWENDLNEFFKAGTEAGAFVEIHPAILTRMIMTLLRDLISPEFLKANDLTVLKTFADFMRMQAEGIFQTDTEDDRDLENKLKDVVDQNLRKPGQ